MLNLWSDKVVSRLEHDWNSKNQPGVEETFSMTARLGNSFLDVGCGYGRFYAFLLEKGDKFSYIGYDSSEAMIDKAEAMYNNSDCFILHDVTKPFIHSMDVVLCNELFIHLLPEVQEKVLGNINSTKSKAIVISIQIKDDKDIIEEHPLEGESFINVIQNESTFIKTIADSIQGIRSISIHRYKLNRKVYKTVFIIGRHREI